MIFFLNTYKHDIHKAKITVKRIKELYPKHRILVRYDGIIDYIEGCYQVYDSRIYHENNGGLITHTYLKYCLKLCNFNYLVKIDPDTWFNDYYDFRQLDKRRLHCNSTKTYTYGGLIIYSYQVAKKIYNSKLLLDNKYTEDYYNYGNKKLKEKMSCQDLIIRDVCHRLNINIKSVSDFAEICLHKIHNLKNSEVKIYHSW